jgi:ABC-type glycerol-3-phosphate transport system substrate-binding protein
MRLRTFGSSGHLRLHPNLGLAGPDGNRPIVTEGWVLAVPKASPHPEEAKAFIGLLMEPKMQAMAMATESKIYTGGFPARADALDLIPDVVREWFDLVDVEQFKRMAFKNFVTIPYTSYWGSLSRLMGELYRSVVTEGGDVGRALDLAQADLELMMRAVQK